MPDASGLLHRDSPIQTFVHPLLALCSRTCFHRGMPWDFWLIFLFLGALFPGAEACDCAVFWRFPHFGTLQRLTLYASTIAFQWVTVSFTFWRVWTHGFTAKQSGLVTHDQAKIALSSVAGAVIFAGLQWMNLRRVGRRWNRVVSCNPLPSDFFRERLSSCFSILLWLPPRESAKSFFIAGSPWLR